MRIARLKVKNFRGVKEGELYLTERCVLVGDNNIGKSTILESIDLVLGPERLSKYPVLDEHDFYAGEYLNKEGTERDIHIEVVVVGLSDEQTRHFRNHIEWWNTSTNNLIEGPPASSTDERQVLPALRVGFSGAYDQEEDDFVGKTYYLSPQKDDGTFDVFGTKDKRMCGFLYLRTLRTGSRALSLEKGSLLDIILRLKELNLPMWEDILNQLRELPVAENPELGISEILTSVQKTVRTYVPSDWANNPHFRVSDLTRSNLRRILTVFMGTGAKREDGNEYAAPFQHQGTGTINTLVLALLSMIAELKQNVIFAMEEPEIAIPPYTQKRIIHSISRKSAQAIFTSHSPYVLEEFDPSEILVINRVNGKLKGVAAKYPPTIKPKKYREEFRRRFCEALLARRVLITEGRTEFDSFPAAARRLQELGEYKTFEELGIAILNAEAESQVAPLGEYLQSLDKITFAVFDKQTEESKTAIVKAVNFPFEANEKGFEDVIINGSSPEAILRYAKGLVENGEWLSHMKANEPNDQMDLGQLKTVMREFFVKNKASGVTADFLGQCEISEMPSFVVETIVSIQSIVDGRSDSVGSDREVPPED
ncbi:AAA family ATPase (plasmid) [Paenibacillus rhizovicinus]|uniref:AAA family ATPase n=1 Tax=Paenibacillus rhizovicinus TaxID=2704463 RepID=A0A6C0P8V2_9BACL|nr:AAA family ATPase [Paenibacillus rhizovicinus]QHW34846.1 AAA family ATPase [Paenibacillus rhizovicinus]QHW35609.1 AAA family ATPase [Paenibacillus rhizovicinus]